MGTALLFQMAIICSKVNYSRDTNTGQVWYSDHGDLSDCRTVCCSDHHLKNGQNCPLFRYHLNNVLASEYRTISPLFRCPIHFIGQAACYFSNGSLIQMSIIRIPTVMLSYIPLNLCFITWLQCLSSLWMFECLFNPFQNNVSELRHILLVIVAHAQVAQAADAAGKI